MSTMNQKTLKILVIAFGIFVCVNSLTHQELDDFLEWNNAIKDQDEFYHAMLKSSRNEMTSWMVEINAQFLTQIAITVDGLNAASLTNGTNECVVKKRKQAGEEIQTIVQEAMSDLTIHQNNLVWLLLDVTDQYISFNQKWPKRMWSEHNMVSRMDIITYLMENYVYFFYKSLFEAQVEEIIIEMRYFNVEIDEIRRKAFVALNNVGQQTKFKLLSCY